MTSTFFHPDQIRRTLYADGFVPLLASNAHDAVDFMAGKSAPVLIVLDLDTPGLEPAQLVARLRKHWRWARVPVVVTGSNANLPGHVQVAGVLPKPFEAVQVVALARGR